MSAIALVGDASHIIPLSHLVVKSLLGKQGNEPLTKHGRYVTIRGGHDEIQELTNNISRRCQMNIADIEFPDDLYYDRQHDWARVEGNLVVLGMTDFGQSIAQEIVFVEIPPVGRAVEQGQTFMSIESGKWVGRIQAMASGKIVEVNEELDWEPTLVNESPFDEGWLVKIEMSAPAELKNLMRADSPDFRAFIEEEAGKYQDLIGK